METFKPTQYADFLAAASACCQVKLDVPDRQQPDVGLYEALRNQWLRLTGGAGEDYVIDASLWQAIEDATWPGCRTLETGSGLSTWLFGVAGCRHVALEHSPHYFHLIQSSHFTQADVRLRQLRHVNDGYPPWYSVGWDEEDLQHVDVLLIDGPPGEIGRRGIVPFLESLTHEATVVFVDDADRPEEAYLVDTISDLLGEAAELFTCSGPFSKRFARIGG